MVRLGFDFLRLPLKGRDDGGRMDHKLLAAMADRFLNSGFSYFDAAYAYHGKTGEEAAREAVVKRHPRAAFQLASQLPLSRLLGGQDQERMFVKQLKRCGVDYFDCYLLHGIGSENYRCAVALDSFAFLEKKKREGKIGQIGLSYHGSGEWLDRILLDHPEVDFVQLQVNYLDWDSEGIRFRKCCEVAQRQGKPIVAADPFKGDALVQIPIEAEELLRKHSPGRSAASWALRYAASQAGIETVLCSIPGMGQLADHVNTLTHFVAMRQEEYQLVKQAAAIIDDAIVIPCTACRCCVNTCPRGIAIPQYFALYNRERQFPAGSCSIQRCYYHDYRQRYGAASDCTGCKQCEQHCPQQLPIAEFLKYVACEFEFSCSYR